MATVTICSDFGAQENKVCHCLHLQTAGQLYQRNSYTVEKVLGPTADFPTWGSGKGTENAQGIWLWRPVGFDHRTSTGLGKQILGGHKPNLCALGARRNVQCPHKRLSQTCLWVSRSGGMGQQFGLRPNNREGTQSHPSTENYIKDLLSMALPIRTRSSFPHSQCLPSGSFHKPLILIHQRADRMKTTITETNQTDHMDHSLV